ncbi:MULTISPECIES: roadblock/LC7 domain-containing protein [unclassified Oceanobacter]|jgi:predicted regulator of Ras-like GTPase activity (Roadblock/LC7/MglB family)|uniref:roadblock/LC7 domain-containing protein n=1 Tax=unclassified Oceanobacter TaxID=2620260 RepID=UPI0026E42453|nr:MULTISPECIES: roadblock/LC7 domain-containing protein [unclassified Oceanobacter]MDO6683219.1 roadblock/LC7 domain-containing protein [Oceanobacter sp. 5_MG-2023]MDP2506182.1 roadblock/LC7 domain-containing protein [Oceanobacter sp. 3_MG-2023]MDP2547277.1 roadblock/LC7 domain-containing protein [Oceanobacter sp. 4_MG-2023]MDP2607401.1 roadblock/LC7 domain-containing protein [Oceanobacter sp. 1_MG-2023]MDP2610669.1 roadblock/LC7 domain-containing protein [Oceanobacter sp. 2_MG-2023]
MNDAAPHPEAKQIFTVLSDMITNSEGAILATAAMTTDGLIISSALGKGIDSDIFAAMSASLLVLAERASQEVDIGELNQVMVMGSQGVMLLTHIGLNAVLAVSTTPSANLGMVLQETSTAVNALHDLLG